MKDKMVGVYAIERQDFRFRNLKSSFSDLEQDGHPFASGGCHIQ